MWRRELGRILWNAEGDGGGSGSEGGGTTTQPAGGGQERTFTQDEVNAFVAERARHAKSSALSELLTDLGVEKVDDLKTTLQKTREREQAEMTEAQRLQAQLAEYQQKEQTWAQEKRAQALQIAVQGAAGKLGIVDPDVALTLVREKVQFDDAGAPQGVEAALTELLAQKPYLRGAVSSGSPTNPPRGNSATLTKEDIAKMSPEQINARWDEVSAVLESGR